MELDSQDRVETMKKFLMRDKYEPISKLTMSQFSEILKYNLIPDGLKDLVRIKNFKDYALHESFFLKNIITEGKKIPKRGYHDRYFSLDEKGTSFLLEYFSNCIVGAGSDGAVISEKEFVKEWEKLLEPLKEFMSKESTLEEFNRRRLEQVMCKYASGSKEKWDMESLCYYPDKHELYNIDESKYGIVNFNDLPVEPEPYDFTIRKIKGETKYIPRFYIVRLAGTVLDSDNNRHIVTLLTNHGVVNCKYNRGHYSFYNKRISTPIEGTDKKKVLEESWFKRGTKLIVSGYRRDDQFVVTRYKDTVYMHTTNRIEEVYPDGKILVQTERRSE